jgi:hypothetical protein
MNKIVVIVAVGISIVLMSCFIKKKEIPEPVETQTKEESPVQPFSLEALNPYGKPANGVYKPGVEEEKAIQQNYPHVTLATLEKGYSIFTGACTNCHQPYSIHQFSEKEWIEIMEYMAPQAALNPQEKASVLAYVLSIKAVKN